MQETVSFDSHGLKLSGVVRIPDNAKGKVPAFLLLHGFGSNKEAHWMYLTAELLAKIQALPHVKEARALTF